jgi:ABC-type amino acid transport substrate-binding protein
MGGVLVRRGRGATAGIDDSNRGRSDYARGMLLLLLQVALAQAPVTNSCDVVRMGTISDGYFRCAGLPFEVRFPGETKVENAPNIYATYGHWAKFAGSETDGAMVIHQRHAWERGDAVDDALHSLVTEGMKTLADPPPFSSHDKPPTVKSVEIAERGRTPNGELTYKLRAKFKDVEMTAQVRAVHVQGRLVALFVWGKPGAKYAPGSKAAAEFLGSFRVVETKGVDPKKMYLHPGLELTLPAGVFAQGTGEYAVGYGAASTKPLGVLAFAAIDRTETLCEGDEPVTLEQALLGSERLEFTNPKITTIEAPGHGKGYLVEGPLPRFKVPNWATNYLFCNGKTWPVRVLLISPTQSPEALALVRQIAESVTGPDLAGRRLRVAMSGTYWPLHSVGGGTCFGLEVDLAVALGRELGKPDIHCVSKEELDGLSALDAVAKGKVDVALNAITVTDERRKLVDFTEPYVTLRYRLLRTAAPDVADLAQLADKSIAVPSGPTMTALGATLTQAKAKLVEVKSVSDGLKLLRAGTVEYFAGEDLALVELMDYATESLTGPPMGASPIAMAVPKGSLPRYEPAMKKLAPEIEALRRQYRPGEAVDEIGFTACEKGPVERWTTLATKTLTFDDEKVPARSGESHVFYEDHKVCLTELARIDSPPPKAILAQVRKLMAEQKAEVLERPEGLGVPVIRGGSFEAETDELKYWRRVPGAKLAIVPWELNQICVVDEDDWDCGEQGFFIFAVQGTKVSATTLKIRERMENPY